MSEIKQFEQFCDNINEKCINLQEIEKEYILDEIAFEAYSYIQQMKLELAGDYLLFLSALNLLNTYVKQSNAKIGYSFKKEIDYFLENCIKYNKNILKINMESDEKGKVLLIQLNNIQFSFHSVKCNYEEIGKNFDKNLKWDGIRKQKCAFTLYTLCKNNQLLRCNKTFRGVNLNKKINRLVDNYKKEIITFDSIL